MRKAASPSTVCFDLRASGSNSKSVKNMGIKQASTLCRRRMSFAIFAGGPVSRNGFPGNREEGREI